MLGLQYYMYVTVTQSPHMLYLITNSQVWICFLPENPHLTVCSGRADSQL